MNIGYLSLCSVPSAKVTFSLNNMPYIQSLKDFLTIQWIILLSKMHAFVGVLKG